MAHDYDYKFSQVIDWVRRALVKDTTKKPRLKTRRTWRDQCKKLFIEKNRIQTLHKPGLYKKKPSNPHEDLMGF